MGNIFDVLLEIGSFGLAKTGKKGAAAPAARKDKKVTKKEDVVKTGSRAALIAGVTSGVQAQKRLSTSTGGRGTLLGN